VDCIPGKDEHTNDVVLVLNRSTGIPLAAHRSFPIDCKAAFAAPLPVKALFLLFILVQKIRYCLPWSVSIRMQKFALFLFFCACVLAVRERGTRNSNPVRQTGRSKTLPWRLRSRTRARRARSAVDPNHRCPYKLRSSVNAIGHEPTVLPVETLESNTKPAPISDTILDTVLASEDTLSTETTRLDNLTQVDSLSGPQTPRMNNQETNEGCVTSQNPPKSAPQERIDMSPGLNVYEMDYQHETEYHYDSDNLSDEEIPTHWENNGNQYELYGYSPHYEGQYQMSMNAEEDLEVMDQCLAQHEASGGTKFSRRDAVYSKFVPCPELDEFHLSLWQVVKLSYATSPYIAISQQLTWDKLMHYASHLDEFRKDQSLVSQFALQVSLALIYMDEYYDNFCEFFPCFVAGNRCLARRVLRYSLELPTVGPRAAAYLKNPDNYKVSFPLHNDDACIGAFSIETVIKAVARSPSFPAAFPPGTEPSTNLLRNFFLNIDYSKIVCEERAMMFQPFATVASSFSKHEYSFKANLFGILLFTAFKNNKRPEGLLMAIEEAVNPDADSKPLALDLFEKALRESKMSFAKWIYEVFEFNHDRAVLRKASDGTHVEFQFVSPQFIVVRTTKCGHRTAMQIIHRSHPL
jgi:hypothetical protein